MCAQKGMNYFSPGTAAARYKRGRPRFHPLIINRIRESLSITKPLRLALDVGCGTGLSTVALKEIAREVVGLDVAREMLALAERGPGVDYVHASAESLPLGQGEFELVTLSQAFHWLDRDRFLREAYRVLRPQGALLVYDNYFRITDDARFQRWHSDEYLKRYPDPPRPKTTFTAENTRPFGFEVYREEALDNFISFSPEGLIDYLVSQSNVIAAVEGGRETIESARSWLTATLTPLFGDEAQKQFLFKAPIWQLSKG